MLYKYFVFALLLVIVGCGNNQKLLDSLLENCLAGQNLSYVGEDTRVPLFRSMALNPIPTADCSFMRYSNSNL